MATTNSCEKCSRYRHCVRSGMRVRGCSSFRARYVEMPKRIQENSKGLYSDFKNAWKNKF